MNAAICSRLTLPDGSKVVAEVPLVRPEKYAAAIEQKKAFVLGTSVNGNAMLVPLQVPTSACNRVETTVRLTSNEISNATRVGNDLRFISWSPPTKIDRTESRCRLSSRKLLHID